MAGYIIGALVFLWLGWALYSTIKTRRSGGCGCGCSGCDGHKSQGCPSQDCHR